MKFAAKFVKQTDAARLLRSQTGKEEWIPKSITTYYRNDGNGNVVFSVEGWKNKELRAAGFDEAETYGT